MRPQEPVAAERIRLAVPDDARGLAEVHVRTWQEAYRRVFPDEFLNGLDVDRRVDWWERHLREGARVFVADVGGVVGFCAPAAADEDRWGEIRSIYVDPEHWGTGLGRDLLIAGEAELAAGFDQALLWVLEPNQRARDFYARNGWELGKPIRIEEIGGVQVTEVRYEKDLRESTGPAEDLRDR